MFGIFLHETNIKESRLLNVFDSKLEALGYLEEIVDDYITQKEGEERGREELIKEPSSIFSRRWNILPWGHFKTRNTDESLHKITVWNKVQTKGYLYNSYDIVKVFSIDILFIPKSQLKKDEEEGTLVKPTNSYWDFNKIDDTSLAAYTELYREHYQKEVLPEIKNGKKEIGSDTEEDIINHFESYSETSDEELDAMIDELNSLTEN